MAVAADMERINFAEIGDYDRSPKTEIYGRSLSSIYHLGRAACMSAEAANTAEADQARAEFYTSVEEGFGTDENLGAGLEVRVFDRRRTTAGRVMAKDGKRPVSDMTRDGLTCAQEKFREESAQGDERFLPQLIRSVLDHENAEIGDQMVRGETDYNTRIVPSLCPEEGIEESGPSYWGGIGYVPHLRRGFIQLYHATEDGMVTGSLSFDGGNIERVREVFARYGIEIPEGEITDNFLKYAITGTLTEDQAKALALEIADACGDPNLKKTTNTVDITVEHREIMDRVFNESYVAACESVVRGCQTPALRQLVIQLADNAHNFNERYAKSLFDMRTSENRFSDDDMVVIHELLVYSTIEMMRALLIEKTSGLELSEYIDSLQPLTNLHALDAASFQGLIGGYGGYGASQNRTYFACGLSISPGAEQSQVSDSPQSVYGGVEHSSLAWAGGRTHRGKCVNCGETTQVGVKNWCKPCISGHCGVKK